MKEKLVKQTVMGILLALALLLADHSQIPVLEKGAQQICTQMAVEYTWDDVKKVAGRAAEKVKEFPQKAEKTVRMVTGKPALGEPIDGRRTGRYSSVYAVSSGQVVAAGEDETIGNYVRISHGKEGESLYGNLEKILVKAPAKVKRGQIIGTYDNTDQKDFYYSFNVAD